ncbi:hypothetical protein [Maribacter hydrothermalis]|uniref:Uncharacterized protein n=1 Tax=Maribacter hydrothermalis TaxID=1836467 RepID=A0A1B7Z386_9FLAO|nr:hypothetical protein [Maribacter hydrothermalis]APQ16921.1 hypothetical protein BTR34_06125 [Maribacter hydrothermalis]OBR37183.1 hypothetical protein A9200_05885 [Maribacter hydrothermalis]
MNKVEINQGEIKVKLSEPSAGKLSFEKLGIKKEDVTIESGLLRLVFDLEAIRDYNYYQVPTIEIFYEENMSETHWICEFNGKTILDKLDHHGHSTILLLNRNELSNLEQHHENVLIVHAEFPQPANLNLKESSIHFFK